MGGRDLQSSLAGDKASEHHHFPLALMEVFDLLVRKQLELEELRGIGQVIPISDACRRVSKGGHSVGAGNTISAQDRPWCCSDP